MARSLRIQYPGAFYHVMARGNGRRPIYRGDADRSLFLETLGEACGRTGWQVHAWVLMDNHYHIVLSTPEANLVAGMQWLQNAYTRRFNTRRRHWGRLFGDRYKAVPVEGSGYYYQSVLDYVHLNPARAGLVTPRSGGSVLDYPWSSVAKGYAAPPRGRPAWLAVSAGLSAFGYADSAGGRRAFVKRLDELAAIGPRRDCGVPVAESGNDKRRSDLRRGWYWGTQAFAERLLSLGEKLLTASGSRSTRGTPESRSHGEREAERLLQEGLKNQALSAQDLERLPGSDPRKVVIAAEVWQRTAVSLSWIAARLLMRSAANASQQIRRFRLRNGRLRPKRHERLS